MVEVYESIAERRGEGEEEGLGGDGMIGVLKRRRVIVEVLEGDFVVG